MKKSKYSTWTYIRFFLVGALVLAIAGCSGRVPSATTLPPSDAGGEGAIITFAADEFQRRIFEPLIETFHEQNPNITVQFVDISQAFSSDEEWNQYTYFKNLAQAADTFILYGPFILDLSRYFRDLQPLYESDPSFEPDDFWPDILTACEDAFGNVVGLPLTSNTRGIFYDEAAFDAAGVPHPKPGWTWDEFQNAVAALADKRGSQVKYGFYDEPDLGGSILAPLISDHLRSNGGEVDAATLLDEIKWYIDFGRAEMLSGPKANVDFNYEWMEQRMKMFKDDALRPAMWIDNLFSFEPSGESTFVSDNPFSGMAIDRFGIAPFPVSNDGSSTQASRSWVECAAISAGSINPRAAWAWLNFLSRQWLVMDKTLGYELARAPARPSVAESNGYWDLLPTKAVPVIRYALEHGSYDYNYIDQFGEINLALAKAISENADFEQTLETAIAARPATSTPPAADNAPIVVATPLAPPPEDVTVIKYFSVNNPNGLNALKTLIEQFNQRSNDTNVSLITDIQSDPGEDWIASVVSNADCFTTNAPYWEGFDASLVLNLNSLLSKESASFSSDFSPELMDIFRKEGNLYALPASSQVQMMVYNADLLTRRGLPLPTGDWAFGDFIELASAAASTSETDPSYGFSYYISDEFLIRGKGVKWADFKSYPPKVYFDSPEMLEYLRWLSDLEQNRAFFNVEEWGKMNSIMSSGQLAFWTAWMGEETMWFNVYGSSQEPPYKLGLVPLPKALGEEPINAWRNDLGHFISAQSKAPQACWDWIKFMSDQPTLFAGVPARLSLAESPAWEASVGKENVAAYRAAIANHKSVELGDTEIMQIAWPLYEWRNRAVKATLEGQEIQSVLIAQQQKAEMYLTCALALDMNIPMGQLSENVRTCIRQADPEGNW